ncbi:hypothetical protein [Sinomicrobium weinanense]|uniref:DUF2946 domain-containing protein n=1 Tax=Sinomicrobium weinanense TaxID=2842200 RepID=A0A926JTF7_9FLAO|nr:hypothetical protein [Sinomicrobium weinanense]MBC9797207.1 hypothetical protein [Sinomicrobium weinanense]MBU3122729.1 hypothetical protein [Sinomicrobium weinanense]
MKRSSGHIAFFFLILFCISQLAYPLHILNGSHSQETEAHVIATKIAASGDHSPTHYEQETLAHNYCDCLICMQSRTVPAFGQHLPLYPPVLIPAPTTRKYTIIPKSFLSIHFTGDNPLRAPPAAA